MEKHKILIAYACGLGAGNPDCAQGPTVLLNSQRMAKLQERFTKTVALQCENGVKQLAAIPKIAAISTELADLTARSSFFITLGGDHTSAIGSYSGAATRIAEQGPLGLIWIDAHLDSHTPESSISKNPHGMPLATLLGHGDPGLTHISNENPTLAPQNVCVIGARSFEAEEQSLLESLGVRIYYMDEVNARGLSTVFTEACQSVQKNTAGFGLSIDVDAIDPQEAPGTGAREPNGLHKKDLLAALGAMPHPERLVGADITEFNPNLDIERRTKALVMDILETLLDVAQRKEHN